MKTIFISCFHPYIARNILSTSAFALLKRRSGLRIVIFVPAYKKEYFQQRFGGGNVMIEGIEFQALSSFHFFSLAMKRLAVFGLDTRSTRLEKYRRWKLEGNFFYFLATLLIGFFLGHIKFLRRIMRWGDYRGAVKDRYRHYFGKYHPALVVACDLQNERDVELVHNARFFGVHVAGMLRSWDNLTLRGLLRAVPDTLIVTSPRVREYALRYHDLKPREIEMVGVPHYDKYVAGPVEPRESFFAKFCIPAAEKFILFSPISDYYIPDNDTDPYLIKLLGTLSYWVLVRFSPTLPVIQLDDAIPGPRMIFDRPGVNFKKGMKGDQELSDEDDDCLLAELSYARVVVCGPSSIALDAVWIDKPVVVPAFHPRPRSYIEGTHRYDYDHFRFAIACGAIRVARSPEEFFELIEKYMQNPSLDREGREKLRAAYCGSRDGKSGERLAGVLLKLLE